MLDQADIVQQTVQIVRNFYGNVQEMAEDFK